MNDWKHTSHSNRQIYQVRVEKAAISLATIEEATLNDIGAVKQTISPESYRGKRVRFRGDLSTNDSSGSGLWLTAAHQDWHITDGMYDRLVTGDTVWQPIELVIDIPVETTYLSYGLWMKGNGVSKLRNPIFEVIEHVVPVTTREIWDRVSKERWVKRS